MKKLKLTKEKIALFIILIISAVLNFANIGIEGYGNSYYAAGVKSMTMSFKNFFFVSYDPAGFVSIDKPPLGFWIQAIFAKVFGYHGWSILLPEALAGVISVYLIYKIVKKSFGSIAGLISAICLATTPIFVAVSRNNTIDNLLVLALLFSCLAFSKIYEKGKSKYLYICLILVGVGFNIKMLQAYMIIPAIYITYLLISGVSIKKKLISCIIGTVILVSVSLSWAFVVDLVPSKYRPYVGSSTNNTVMELIFGHNGVERLSSSDNGMGGGTGSKGEAPGNNSEEGFPGGQNSKSSATNGQNTQDKNANNSDNSSSSSSSSKSGKSSMGNPPSMQNSQGGNGGQMGGPGGNGGPSGNGGQMRGLGGNGGPGGNSGNGGGNSTFGGSATSSITRLFSNNSLSDQVIWLFPLAIFGFAAVLIREKFKRPFSEKTLSAIYWLLWMLPMFIYFSFTKGLFHPYYLTMLAPPIAALTGIGIVTMWDFYKEGGYKSFLLPASLIVDGLCQMLILSYYNSYNAAKILMTVLSILCFISAVMLIILNIIKYPSEKLKKIFVITSVTGLLIAPAVWSGTTMVYAESGTFPSAGLSLAGGAGGMGQGGKMNGEMNGMPNMNNEGSSQNQGNMNNSSSEDNSNAPNSLGTQGNSNSQENINSQGNSNEDVTNDGQNSRSMGGGMEGIGNTSKLIEYLNNNKSNEKYLLVVSSCNSGSEYIIKSGISVMSLGGFTGNDNIITLAQFKQMVKNGEVRYALAGGNQGGNSEIMSWIKKNGKQVDISGSSTKDGSSSTSSSNSSSDSTSNDDNKSSSTIIYDLKGTVN